MTHRPSSQPARGRGDGGGALVELAIALPFLVMLVFGIYAVGQGYHAKTELTGAVREGARAAALAKSDVDITAAVRRASPGLTPAPTVTVVKNCRTAGTATDAEVLVEYDVPYSIPFVSRGTWHIDEKAVMRCGL
jgi:Flp pilus assembly protein TadG